MEVAYDKLDLHSGDICYGLKKHDPEKNVHSTSSNSQAIKDEVFSLPKMQRVIQEVASDSGRDVKEVEGVVRELLDEIGHKMFLPAVRSLVIVLRATIRQVVRGVYVNTDGITRVREAMLKWPVILLPSHRSYLDFILVSFLMFQYNITLPCIATGQDFMSMRGVSSLLRRSGAFFLRRTFGSDKLYKAVFSLYVQTLLCSGDYPLEFFIEGTRSRTAKALHPRLGLLSMVVEPYLDGRLPDIMIAPMSISYERTLEEQLFAREQLGVPKPKESTKGLFQARSMLTEDYGSIFMHIGPIISLHDVCQQLSVSRVPHALIPRDVSELLPDERHMITRLGHMILDEIHQGMKIFPSAMIAAVLLQNTNGIHRGDLVLEVERLKEDLVSRGALVEWSGAAGDVVASGLALLHSAVQVGANNCVYPQSAALHSGASAAAQQSTSFKLAEVVKMTLNPAHFQAVSEVAFTHLLLGHYRNQILHLYVPEALLALSLHSNTSCDKDAAQQRFELLCAALACEFVFPLKTPQELFAESLLKLLDRGVLQSYEKGELTVNPHKEDAFSFLHGLLLPFIAGVWVTCQHLLSFAGGVQSLNTTIRGAQQLAAKLIHTGVFGWYEALSLTMIKNALASLTQSGLILQPSSEVEGRDRLVKVAKQDKLTKLADELGQVLYGEQVPSARL